MAIFGLFKPRKPRPAKALYESVLAVSRDPAFYGKGAAEDTVDGRFELLALHIAIAHRRLKALDEGFAQALFDAFVKDMDLNLRELGVGDARFGKKMKHIVQSLYGRMQAYQPAFADGDAEALAEALTRNAGGAIAPEGLPRLTAYALKADSAVSAAPLEAFIEARPPWPSA